MVVERATSLLRARTTETILQEVDGRKEMTMEKITSDTKQTLREAVTWNYEGELAFHEEHPRWNSRFVMEWRKKIAESDVNAIHACGYLLANCPYCWPETTEVAQRRMWYEAYGEIMHKLRDERRYVHALASKVIVDSYDCILKIMKGEVQ